MTNPAKLHHVCVCVTDLKTAEDFYVGRLGFRKLREFSLESKHAQILFGIRQTCRFLTLESAAGRVELLSAPGLVPAPAPGQHFCLILKERDRLADELRQAGVPIKEIMREGRRIVFASDPDHNLIELKPW